MYLVSYNRSLLTNHNKWIWLHDLLGFLWFPMAYLCLQIIRNRFAYMVSYCFQLPFARGGELFFPSKNAKIRGGGRRLFRPPNLEKLENRIATREKDYWSVFAPLRPCSFWCVSRGKVPGFLHLKMFWKSWKKIWLRESYRFPMAYLCSQIGGFRFPARFTWFLMVSYGLAVVRNHRKSIWLHVFSGFLWFPMAFRYLQSIQIHLR